MTNNRADIPSAKYTLKENMEAFDRLPKYLREALANSANNWSAASFQRSIKKAKKKQDVSREQILGVICKKDSHLAVDWDRVIFDKSNEL